MVGLGDSISYGYLVVHHTYIVVLTDLQGEEIGKLITSKMEKVYG